MSDAADDGSPGALRTGERASCNARARRGAPNDVIAAVTRGHSRRARASRDTLEHRQRGAHLPRGRCDTAPRRAARLLARREAGEARRPRLLGARGPVRVAELERVRMRDAGPRRAVDVLHEGNAPSSGTRRSARATTSCSCSAARRPGFPSDCSRSTRSGSSRCRCVAASCGRSISRRAWGSRRTRRCGSDGHAARERQVGVREAAGERCPTDLARRQLRRVDVDVDRAVPDQRHERIHRDRPASVSRPDAGRGERAADLAMVSN